MKRLLSALMLVFLLNCISHAQLKNILNHAKDKATEKVNNKVDKTADQPTSSTDNPSPTPAPDQTTQNNTSQAATNNPVSITSYQNYDFRAGDKIIFEDNFATDQDGEFPSHWDLTNGQAVVNKLAGTPAFFLTDGNYCRVHPLIKSTSYLTDNFSVELDVYPTEGAYGTLIFFADANGGEMRLQTNAEGITFSGPKDLSGSLPAVIQYANYYGKWHHIAIAYKNDQMKVYVDQYRVLTVPHCDFKPTKVECGGIGDQNNPIIFKDFKIADGASMNMLDKIMTDGKFITHGINFDINKSVLKPESMGVINDIVKYMQANASLKLEVDGHTDSDGADGANLTLSQQRADAVKAAMVAAGIDASRLTTKGFGESKPLGTNDTPEGKATNRRVEFVKM